MKLPLYSESRAALIASASPRDHDPACNRCALSNVRTVCMRAEQITGADSARTLLVVGEWPSRAEDQTKRPFTGPGGQRLRGQLAKLWPGDVIFDHAVRCSLGNDERPSAAGECRPFLASTLRDAPPERILALGQEATRGLLGRAVNTLNTRRGYAWLDDAMSVPIFLMPRVYLPTQNRILAQHFDSDLLWALRVDPASLPRIPSAFEAIDVDSPRAAEHAAEIAREASWVSFDCETWGVMHEDFHVHAVALSLPPRAGKPTQAFVWGAEALADEATRAPLLALLADPDVVKVGQNVKFDMNAIECAFRTRVRGIGLDTRLVRKMLESDADASLATQAELVGLGGHKGENEDALEKAQKLIGLARRRLKKHGLDETLLMIDSARTDDVGRALSVFVDADKPKKFRETLIPGEVQALELAIRHPEVRDKAFAYALVPHAVTKRYVARDAVTTAMLADHLGARLRSSENAPIARIWDRVASRATEAVQRLEQNGIGCSLDAIQAYRSFLNLKQLDVNQRLAPYAFNPDSVKETSELLFQKLRLPGVATTRTGALSTSRDSLEHLRLVHPIVPDILEHRRLAKLRGTYADGMLQHVRADGRVHPDYNIDGARSGRMSCSNPNLQNIPRPDPLVPETVMARDIFVAQPLDALEMDVLGRLDAQPWGNAETVFVSLDFSQLELRVAAALSGDPEMQKIFHSGVDFHQRTAEMISKLAWGIPPEQVTKKHRTAAKVVNFALLYGMMDETLAAQIWCSVAEAARIRSAILGKFKRLAAWLRDRLSYARRFGHCWTWWDGEKARRRDLPDIASTDRFRQLTAENGSGNTPIQGTGSDFCLASLIEVVSFVERERFPARVVLTVHDSIMAEVRRDCARDFVRAGRNIMESWPLEGVPIVVDAEVGETWGSMKAYEENAHAA